MITVHPQYITDTAGQQLVVLPVAEFNSIIDELEELEDVRLYDEAKKNDTGERIPMEEAFKIIEAERGKKK
jgi:PHD/YefM family antitoxin component YafN of YafNO toxin-antitoxin module